MIENTELIQIGAALISNVGFPVFVSLYLLLRFEKIINKHTQAIETLLDFLDKKR